MRQITRMSALLFASLSALFGQPAVEELHNLSLVVQKIGTHVAARDLAPVLSYDYVSFKAFQFLLQQPALAIPEKQTEVKAALSGLMTKLNAVRNAARDQNQALALARYQELPEALAKLKALYPADMLRALTELSDRYFCPTHPGITGQKGHTCSTCGRSLQPMDEFCGLPSTDPIIKVSMRGETNLLFRLTRKDGAPVTENDLLPTHTERIHLFAIDPTLTDYHHEHPRPTKTPGEYTATINPKFPGGYRVWLELMPAASRREELPSVDIGRLQPAPIKRKPSDEFIHRAYRLKFKVSQPPLKAGFPAWATLTVTDSAGTPCTQLEPLMGNFAHFVAFHEDLQTLFHLHAAGLKDITDPALRGGPDVQLYLPGLKAGFVRLVAQVQINGEKITAPFGLQVQP